MNEAARAAAAKWLAVSRLRLAGHTNLVETCDRCGLMWDVDRVPGLCDNPAHEHGLRVRPDNLGGNP